MSEAPVKLLAKDEGDLAVIAAALQDAILPVKDMHYEKAVGRFALLANRFRWEKAGGSTAAPAEEGERDADFADNFADRPERIASLLVIDRVKAVRRRGFTAGAKAGFLSLLTLAVGHEKGGGDLILDLVFAGGAVLRLEVEAVAVYLQDVGKAWPAAARPDHAGDRP